MLKCLIIEDEPLARQILERYIAQTPALHLVGKAGNAVAAFEALHEQSVDLIFLDIRMPQINGMDFLRSLRSPPMVVFTTAYPEFAVQSYELEAVDYLLKPITLDRFQKCMDKVLRKADAVSAPPGPFPPAREYLFIKVDGKLVRIRFEDILYIVSMKDYLKIHTAGGQFITHMTMKGIEALLPDAAFIRVHRSYMVALDKMMVLGMGSIEVGDQKIPVGESYRKAVALLKTRL